MFQAVRHWWGSGRGKVTGRLFLFEIAVVTVGVLLAQTTTSWVQGRANRAHMEEERLRAREQLATAHMMFQIWRAAIPCLDVRMAEVMSGRGDKSADIARPIFPKPNYTPPDGPSLLLIGDFYSDAERDLYAGIVDNISNLQTRSERIIDLWGRFALLDPANGVPSIEDRNDARRAASDIRSQLKSVQFSAKIGIMRLERMRIPAVMKERPNNGPAKDCQSIWDSGTLDPPLRRG